MEKVEGESKTVETRTGQILLMALIYQTNIQQKTVRTTISTQASAFINLDVSGSYDQISRQV